MGSSPIARIMNGTKKNRRNKTKDFQGDRNKCPKKVKLRHKMRRDWRKEL